MRFRAVTFTLLALCSEANAQDGPQILGIGSLSCHDAIKEIDTRAFQGQLFAWVTGYVSGVNRANRADGAAYRDFRGMNFDVIIGEVRAACGRNPDMPIFSAVEPIFQSYPVVK